VLIAATARAERTVVTDDRGGFAELPGVSVRRPGR